MFALTAVWGFLRGVPTKVWIIVAVVAGVLYYGHWKENRGYEKCQAEIAAVTEALNKKLAQAREELHETKGQLDEEERQHLSQLKEAQDEADRIQEELNVRIAEAVAKGEKPPPRVVCVPKSITDRL